MIFECYHIYTNSYYILHSYDTFLIFKLKDQKITGFAFSYHAATIKAAIKM